MHFTYDNSADNPRNPNQPPKRVRYGLQTSDEMGELWFQVLPREPRERNTLGQDFYKHLAQRTLDYNEHVLKENPKDAEAHTRAGRARLYFGDTPGALEHYNAAVQADPNYDRAWYELGFVYLRQNQLDGAQKAFENVVRLNPDDYQAQGSLGMVYMQKGDVAHAEACLRAALRLNPNDSLARENLERVIKARRRE
jgi:Flp pilus assembly protein TadD